MKDVKLPSNKQFGIFFSLIFLISYIYFKDLENLFIHLFLIFAIIFLILGLKNSKILYPLNFAWYKFGLYLSFIISPLILLLIYLLMIIPIGLFLKILKKDILNLDISDKRTFWLEVKNDQTSMDNQF